MSIEIDELKKFLFDIDYDIDFSNAVMNGDLSTKEKELFKKNNLEFEVVDSSGNVGDDAYWIFRINDKFYQIDGYSDSWHTSISDIRNFYEVEPYEKIIICYRPKGK